MNRETDFTYSEAPIDVTNQMEYDGTLTDQVQQEERSRLLGYFGRAAARVALVGAVLGSALTGQGQDQDETAPVFEATPVLVAAESCTKGGVQGTRIGDLCVTKEKPRHTGDCDIKQIGGLLSIAGLVVSPGAAAVAIGVSGTGLTYYEDRVKRALC